VARCTACEVVSTNLLAREGPVAENNAYMLQEIFQSCAIIIDCFEVFIDRPASLMERAQTWSNYKKHNTYKFLIGITTQGSVSFISKGWGGRVPDVHLMAFFQSCCLEMLS